MKLNIIVTENDIKKGKRLQLTCCPVALAAEGCIPGVVKVRVTGEELCILDSKGTLYIGELPSAVQEAIIKFDYGGQMVPMQFPVELTEFKHLSYESHNYA